MSNPNEEKDTQVNAKLPTESRENNLGSNAREINRGSPPIRGVEFETSYAARKEDVLEDPLIYVSQEPYLLKQYEYIHLKASEHQMTSILNKLLTVSVGYMVIVVSQFVYYSYIVDPPQPDNLADWEITAAIVALLIFGIGSYLSKLILPNERKELMRKIRNHFLTSKERVQSYRPPNRE